MVDSRTGILHDDSEEEILTQMFEGDINYPTWFLSYFLLIDEFIKAIYLTSQGISPTTKSTKRPYDVPLFKFVLHASQSVLHH